ncbi:regulatory signaling modulator protein AmpE [Escherichia coli]
MSTFLSWGEHWQPNHRLEAFFRRVKHFFLGRTLSMTSIAMGVIFLLLRALQGVLFNVPTLLVWLLIGLLCMAQVNLVFIIMLI